METITSPKVQNAGTDYNESRADLFVISSLTSTKTKVTLRRGERVARLWPPVLSEAVSAPG